MEEMFCFEAGGYIRMSETGKSCEDFEIIIIFIWIVVEFLISLSGRLFVTAGSLFCFRSADKVRNSPVDTKP